MCVGKTLLGGYTEHNSIFLILLAMVVCLVVSESNNSITKLQTNTLLDNNTRMYWKHLLTPLSNILILLTTPNPNNVVSYPNCIIEGKLLLVSYHAKSNFLFH